MTPRGKRPIKRYPHRAKHYQVPLEPLAEPKLTPPLPDLNPRFCLVCFNLLQLCDCNQKSRDPGQDESGQEGGSQEP